MACKTSFELHHNFPKLAEDSGFTFNTHKPRIHINWNKIKLIDIENLIKDRKFIWVEEHINDILDCVLESEFDVRILDEGVLKIFRLAQLAVEYQQFCRHYLDRSVYVLREEVNNLLQDLETTKRNLREREDENRKLKRKSKHSFRTPLPYGNENIATMLLKTLNQNKGELFPSTSQIDTMQYNKCSYCEKVFMNQLYLKSHISRRHANVLEIPQRDTADGEINGMNSKLANEVDELKTKLKQMENLIANNCNPSNQKTAPPVLEMDNVAKEVQKGDNHRKETKDAEVSTNEDVYILDKIQEWKKEEHEKYNNELSTLRQQIIDIIKIKENQDNASVNNEMKMMEQLCVTIKEQGSEILTLKQELLNGENSEKEKKKKIEEQMTFWINRAELQSNEYKSLLQKLNEVALEAREFRMQANAEKERAKELEQLLRHHLNDTSPKHTYIMNKDNVTKQSTESHSRMEQRSVKDVQLKPTADVMTLKKLQQKAQELLNIDYTSTSDSSSTIDDKFKIKYAKKESENEDERKQKYVKNNGEPHTIESKPRVALKTEKIEAMKNKQSKKKKSSLKSKSATHATSKKGNGHVYVPGSPLKIVRAKITEEVNHRLISFGVDPLNNRVPHEVFQKQRKLLQEQHEFKSKKWPSRDKVLHSIMCHLDQNTSNPSFISQNDYISPNKSRKIFSLSSVLSNVKTKALSLVKSSEPIKKPNKTYDDVAKKAMALLKTPPGSAHSSPIFPRRTTITSPEKKMEDVLKINNTKRTKYQSSNSRTKKKPVKTEVNYSSNESFSNSDVQGGNQLSSNNHEDLVASPPPHKDNVGSRNQKRDSLHENGLKSEAVKVTTKVFIKNKDNSSDDVESIIDISPRKFLSEENLNLKQTKGVLKNASSTSSLNKKKVLFDMDAIQMKSVSASPSQSITDKSDSNKRYDDKSSVINLDTEEWDISSIENDPVRTTSTKTQISSHTSPKIAELKQTIESQLARRKSILSAAPIGGVDVLATQKAKSYSGSNTSLGSSILDDTESPPVLEHKRAHKPRAAFEKDDSEIEISDLIDDKFMK